MQKGGSEAVAMCGIHERHVCHVGQFGHMQAHTHAAHTRTHVAHWWRTRQLYEKYLETLPHNCYAWTKFAELENSVRKKSGPYTRACART
jgi:hypothetical protein